MASILKKKWRKNWLKYDTEKDCFFNEKEDFMRQMFGIVTTSQETIDYWGE